MPHRWPLAWVVAGVTLLAFVIVYAAREAALLEAAELEAHDHLVSHRGTAAVAPHLEVILEREEDLQAYGHPLSDELLATVIERAFAGGASAVVMDKYRDIPVPPGSERLARAIQGNPNLFWVRKMAEERSPGVRAPALLEGTPQAVCNDMVSDGDGKVRRILLYLDDANGPCYSPAFVAARHALQAAGTRLGFAADGALEIGRQRLQPLERGDGPYVSADMAGYQLPLEPAMRRPPLALGAFLDGRTAPDALRGKVVFFGSGAASMRDFFKVPHAGGGGELSGVELHALAFSSLWHAANGARAPLRLAPKPWAVASILLAALLTAVVVSVVPRAWVALAVTVSIGLAIYAAAVLVMREAAVALPYLPAIIASITAALLAFAVRTLREQAERGEMMSLFGRQVSHEVAASIWKDRDAFYANGRIPDREVNVTALFLDIRSFTTATEILGKGTIGWVNRGLAPLTDIVLAHCGVVTRFVGDQIMAVYGVPIPRTTQGHIEEDARNAVRTALAIRTALDRIGAELEAEGLPRIRVRIGINSGSVIQGAVGSSERFEFSVFGDAVNTAARLESFATEDDGTSARILISGSTLQLCGGIFDTEFLGEMPLKGKTVTVPVHRVHGHANTEKKP